MSDFNINNPTANQLLLWSDVEQAFINVTPDASILNISTPQMNVTKLSSNGESLVTNFSGNTLQTKTLVAGDGLKITTTTSGEVEISFTDNDSTTLNGFSDNEFLKVSNNLSETDPSLVREHLDVYEKDEVHDEFMETNASNIPDKDNTYDLGSNGRRYADIYAKTFHGTATRALIADSLMRKGAKEGDILVWRDLDNDWMPEDILKQYLKKEGLQILPPYGERIHKPSEPKFDIHEANIFYYEFSNLESGTIEFISPADGNSYSMTLELVNGENAGIAWPSNIQWIGLANTPPFSAHDIFNVFTFDGMQWYGIFVGSLADS